MQDIDVYHHDMLYVYDIYQTCSSYILYSVYIMCSYGL